MRRREKRLCDQRALVRSPLMRGQLAACKDGNTLLHRECRKEKQFHNNKNFIAIRAVFARVGRGRQKKSSASCMDRKTSAHRLAGLGVSCFVRARKADRNKIKSRVLCWGES